MMKERPKNSPPPSASPGGVAEEPGEQQRFRRAVRRIAVQRDAHRIRHPGGQAERDEIAGGLIDATHLEAPVVPGAFDANCVANNL